MINKLEVGMAALVIGCLGGCSVGMAPKGPDREQVIANMNKLPPDQEIALIQNGPGTKAYKDKMIADIKARAATQKPQP